MTPYQRVAGVLLIVLVVVTTLLLQSYRLIDILANTTEIWILIAGPLLGIGFGLLTRSKKIRSGPSAEEEQSVSQSPLIRQSRLEKILADLDAHHQGIINRMDQLWDFRPRGCGEQILAKGKSSGQTFGLAGLVMRDLQDIPPNLESDKKHLREFREPWEFYSKGPILFAEAEELDRQVREFVRGYLTSPSNEVEPPCRLVDKLAAEIIERRESRNMGQLARDFEAGMTKVVSDSMPSGELASIDMDVLDGLFPRTNPDAPLWTIADAKKLAKLMNEILASPDLAELVAQRRSAWDAVSKNKDKFLMSLKVDVIGRARNSNYQTPELVRGACDDCIRLTIDRDSLMGK